MCPIYDYKCECGKEDIHYSEVASLMIEADVVVCKCGKRMKRQFATPRINMRGTRGITSRSDVEISTMSVEESQRELANEGN